MIYVYKSLNGDLVGFNMATIDDEMKDQIQQKVQVLDLPSWCFMSQELMEASGFNNVKMFLGDEGSEVAGTIKKESRLNKIFNKLMNKIYRLTFFWKKSA